MDNIDMAVAKNRKKKSGLKKLGFIIALIAVIAVIIVVILILVNKNSNSGDGPTVDDSMHEMDSGEYEEPDYTAKEYTDAIAVAQKYAKTTNLSMQRMYEKMTDENGDAIGYDYARYAVNNIKVDWAEKAYNRAKELVDAGVSVPAVYMILSKRTDQDCKEYYEDSRLAGTSQCEQFETGEAKKATDKLTGNKSMYSSSEEESQE